MVHYTHATEKCTMGYVLHELATSTKVSLKANRIVKRAGERWRAPLHRPKDGREVAKAAAHD